MLVYDLLSEVYEHSRHHQHYRENEVIMDHRLVLAKIITLLYFESKIGDSASSSAERCKKIIENLKTTEEKLALSEGKDATHHLKMTALNLVNFSQTQEIDKDDLLQRLRVNCTGDEDLFFSMEKMIDASYDDQEIKKKIISLRHFINEYERESEVTDIIKKAYQNLVWSREKINSIKDFALDITSKLESFKSTEKKKDSAVVADINFDDKNAIVEALDEMIQEQSDLGIMKTGWKAVNDMLQGGFRRGEFWIMPALQHSYKTGSTLTFFKQIAMNNKPYMIDEKKKPLLVRISFEDTMSQNLRYLYENVHYNEHGEMPEISKMSNKDMANSILTKMSINQYCVILRRVDATRWTYKDLIDYLLELESEGYEIHLLMLDYLSLLPTTGCQEGPSGYALRDLFRRVRAFTSARKITCITPHQLSTEAKQLVRDGHTDFLNQVSQRGYFADCKQLDQEVDGELYFHIVKFNKRAYLWIKRGKHRGVPVIKEDLMDAYFEFPEVGPIIDDIHTHRKDLTRVGGKIKTENGESYEDVEELAF